MIVTVAEGVVGRDKTPLGDADHVTDWLAVSVALCPAESVVGGAAIWTGGKTVICFVAECDALLAAISTTVAEATVAGLLKIAPP